MPPPFIRVNSSWLCGNWRKHHKYHVHLFQEGHEEVNVQHMLAYYILQRPMHLLMLTIDSLFVGLSPTYRVQPKPRWRSAAAQYTLSSGPRREKVKIHLSLFTRVEGQHSCCLHAHRLCLTCIVCNLCFSCFCLYRWFYWDSPQCFPLAIPHGVCCGVWGLHFAIWHTADSSLWPGGQHSLSHTEWPCMVTQRPLVSTWRCHVFLSFEGINQTICPWLILLKS